MASRSSAVHAAPRSVASSRIPAIALPRRADRVRSCSPATRCPSRPLEVSVAGPPTLPRVLGQPRQLASGAKPSCEVSSGLAGAAAGRPVGVRRQLASAVRVHCPVHGAPSRPSVAGRCPRARLVGSAGRGPGLRWPDGVPARHDVRHALRGEDRHRIVAVIGRRAGCVGAASDLPAGAEAASVELVLAGPRRRGLDEGVRCGRSPRPDGSPREGDGSLPDDRTWSAGAGDPREVSSEVGEDRGLVAGGEQHQPVRPGLELDRARRDLALRIAAVVDVPHGLPCPAGA